MNREERLILKVTAKKWYWEENIMIERKALRDRYPNLYKGYQDDEFIIAIYKAEHPSIPVIETTEDKEHGYTSEVMNEEYLKLKRHVSVLRETLENTIITARMVASNFEGDNIEYNLLKDIIKDADEALEQTKP